MDLLLCRSSNTSPSQHSTLQCVNMLSAPTIRECLLADSSPVPYPLLRALMAPLCVCAAPMRLCMSPCPLAIPVDGPTAWLRSTWMASSRRSRRSSIRLCCRETGHRERCETFLNAVCKLKPLTVNIYSELSVIYQEFRKGFADYDRYH